MLNFIKNFILVINHFAKQIEEQRKWEAGAEERRKARSESFYKAFKKREEECNQANQ